MRRALEEAPTIAEALCAACRQHFDEVRRYLDAYRVSYTLVPTLVRGLDYYTRTTFEFVDEAIGAQSSICGGGRYDGLAEALDGASDAGHRLRRRHRAVAALARRGRSLRPRQGIDVFFVFEEGATARRARRADGAARGGPRVRRGLRGAVAKGPAHAGFQARREERRRRRAPTRILGAVLEEHRTVIWRDRMCGEVRADDVGQRVTLSGWVHRRRDHGGLVFIDLRDREGLCQLVINPEHAPEAADVAHGVRNEFVLRAEGEVVARAPELVNPNLATGGVELFVDALDVVSTSPALPFQLDEEGVDETLRLRYRWLDLRRDKLQRNIRLRAQMVSIIRRTMEEAGFMDIQTPILFKPTPEGARDFVVPSRLQPGRFYALPQSPQILKQLLVIAGFDRYYQIAVCFRDEDLRADRSRRSPSSTWRWRSRTRSSSSA